MPDILVRGITPWVHEGLQDIAAEHGIPVGELCQAALTLLGHTRGIVASSHPDVGTRWLGVSESITAAALLPTVMESDDEVEDRLATRRPLPGGTVISLPAVVAQARAQRAERAQQRIAQIRREQERTPEALHRRVHPDGSPSRRRGVGP